MKYYKTVQVNKKQLRVHRVVMESHIGRKLKMNEIVHHKDGDKFNNDISNLEIKTRSEHAKTHIDNLKTARDKNTKYNYNDVLLEKLYTGENYPARKISEITGLPIYSINHYISVHNLKHSGKVRYNA
jgi:hypothetical protein